MWKESGYNIGKLSDGKTDEILFEVNSVFMVEAVKGADVKMKYISPQVRCCQNNREIKNEDQKYTGKLTTIATIITIMFDLLINITK